MKKIAQIVILILLFTANSFAQEKYGIGDENNNWLNNWTHFVPNDEDYDESTKILAGDISENTTLYKRETYLLTGSVFVTNNATLTIEPGTVIVGDFDSKASLTITKGAKIIAEGVETDPIIFTSNRSVRKSGDWGGIIILGNAPTNKYGQGSTALFHDEMSSKTYLAANYGGDSINDNSGDFKYVRIEFAGKRSKKGGYLNGLTLAGVGNETVIDHVMVSYSGGNSIEVLGGSVNMSNIVSFKSSSNDFKFNFGSQAKLSNSLAVRSPYMSNGNGSTCLKVLSYDKKEDIDLSKATTSVIAQNLTLLNDSKDLQQDIRMNLVKEGVFVGEDTNISMDHTVVSGFKPAILFDKHIVIGQEALDKINLKYMFFNSCEGNIFVDGSSNNDSIEEYYGAAYFGNLFDNNGNNYETFIDIKNTKRPDYRLQINGIVALNESKN